jgi:hypothetical protein
VFAYLNLDTILPRLPPASGTALPRVPGNCLPIRAVDALAVTPLCVEPCRAVAAGLLDDHLVWVGLDGFAIVPGAVGASGTGVALAGDGGLSLSHDGQGE